MKKMILKNKNEKKRKKKKVMKKNKPMIHGK